MGASVVNAYENAMATKEDVLRAALEYWKQSTFPAYAGESCRACPRASDGGCAMEHDEDCPYHMAASKLFEIFKAEGIVP